MVQIKLTTTSTGELRTDSNGVLVRQTLKISATLNSGSAKLTLFEDVDGDGDAENSQTYTIQDGTNEYSPSGFEFASSNDMWYHLETDNKTITDTVEIGYVEVSY